MDTTQTFKLVGYYRLLSWLSFGIGVAFVGLGIYLGLWETITILDNNFPAEFDAAIAAANPVPTIALSVVGIVVWQVGKSVALTRTMARAIAAEDDGSDDEQLKSEVLDVVNDQLSGVEKDLRSEIRKVERDVESTEDVASAGTSVSTGGGSTSTTSRSTGGASGGSSRSSGGSSGGSQRSSSSAGGERTSRSGRSQSGSSGSSRSSQSDDEGDDGRTERATDAVSGDDETRSRRKKQSDSDDDPLP